MARIIQKRSLREVCTDPQRRCYNGAWFSSEWQWTDWTDLETIRPGTDEEERLEFWRGLSVYAEKERGKSGKSEYQIVEKEWT